MKTKHIYVCEDNIEGIFTGIYKAWESKYGHENNQIIIEGQQNLELFSEYIPVKSDPELALKVTKSIQNKISQTAYRLLFYTAISDEQEKADLIYRFMILGFHIGANVVNYLSHDVVSKVVKIHRKVSNEVHRFKEFVRFQELENGILFGKIRPESDVLTSIAPHFYDRYPNENWMIYDERRKTAIVHEKYKPWFLVYTNGLDESVIGRYSGEELMFQEAWDAFLQNISIKERENLKLQMNFMPLKYREFMPEFNGNIRRKPGDSDGFGNSVVR